MRKKLLLILTCCVLAVLLAGALASCAYQGSAIVEQEGDNGPDDDIGGQTIEFTVVFKGFDDVVLKTVMVRVGYAATPPAAPTVENYTFDHWDGDYSSVTSDRTIQAVYVRKAYEVFFVDYNETVLSKQTIAPGQKVAQPESPIREGYRFIGWDKDLAKISDKTVVNALYEKSYQRTSDENYNYVIMGKWPQSLVRDTFVIKTLNSGIRTGAIQPNTASGWYKSGGKEYAKVTIGGADVNGYSANQDYFFLVEPIKWRILTVDAESGVGTLVADSVLDIRPYNIGTSYVWGTSEIRTFLNETFYSVALEDYEELMTRKVSLDNGQDSVGYSAVLSEDTEDFVYLFSYAEAMNTELGFAGDYNVADRNRFASATDYATANGANLVDGHARYFLRSPSSRQLSVAYVANDGSIVFDPGELAASKGGIRPTIAVKFPFYDVTFYDEDKKTVLDTQSVIEGYDAIDPAIPVKTGYTFSKWEGDYTKVANDVSIFASYNVNSYTVTFIDFYGETIETQSVQFNENATPPTPPEVEFMQFTSWTGNYHQIKGNVEIKANYEIKKVEVRFEAYGGSLPDGSAIQPVEISYGERVTRPTQNPVRIDYLFMGWFSDENSHIPFDFSAPVYQTVVYAGWAQIGSTIIYNMRSTTGNSVSEPFPLPGYNFDKWYDDVACTKLPTSYSDETAYYAKWTVATKSLKLFIYQDESSISPPVYSRDLIKTPTNSAGYVESEVTLSELVSGRNVEKKYYLLEKTFNIASDLIILPNGERYGDEAPQMSRKGYLFDGWYTNTVKEGEKVTAIPKYSTENVTLYATWTEPISYNIMYTLNGGTNSLSNPLTFTIERADFTIGSPTRAGYSFLGWVENSDAEKKVNNGTGNYFTMAELTVKRGTIEGRTLYACWSSPIVFRVEYSVGVGAELPEDAPIEFDITTGLTLVEPVCESITSGIKTYKQFLGWYTSADCINIIEDVPIGYVPEYEAGTGRYTLKLFAKWSVTYLSPLYSYDENDSTNKTVYFGDYPQSLVTDSSLISEIEMNITILETEGRSNVISLDPLTGWYSYEGNRYAIVVADPCGGYKFINSDVTVQAGEKYFFRVDKLKWTIVQSSSERMMLFSKLILTALPFNTAYDSQKETYYASWKDSTLREWLNNEFLNTAFDSDSRQLIMEYSVDNTKMSMPGDSRTFEGADTEDYIFLPAYNELIDLSLGMCSQTTTGADEKREGQITDYAIATGAFMNTDNYERNGYYWTRSPATNDETKPRVGIVTSSGSLGADGMQTAEVVNVGIRPIVNLDLKASVAEKVYTVIFKDYYGNVISEQRVYYGETAGDRGVRDLLSEVEGKDFVRWETSYADESMSGEDLSYLEGIYADLVVTPMYEDDIG